MVKSNKTKEIVFFQIVDAGALQFSFKGTIENLRKQVESDMKKSIKQIEDTNKDIKLRLKKLPKDGSLTNRHLETQNKLKIEANEKELKRLKAMTLKDFEFYTCTQVNLDA